MKLAVSVKATTSVSKLRRTLALFLPFAFLFCSGAYLLYRAEVQKSHDQRARKERETIIAGTESIGYSLQDVGRDLLFLVAHPNRRTALNDASEQNLAKLASDWIAFSNAKQVYDKIRWIDEHGMEVLRVDYEPHGALVIWKSELQDKANRYFFTETNKLDKGRIFVSPLDLNVDFGAVETPHKPTIRLGAPIFDDNDKRRGILLINYAAAELLERFAQATRLRGRSNWLVNQDGYWLKGNQPTDEFGFMLNRKNATLAQQYPQAWQQISRKEEGQFETAAGLWTFSTIRPLRELAASRNASGKSIHNIHALSDYAWKHVSFMPAEEYNEGTLNFGARLGAGTFLFLLFFLWAIIRKVNTRIEKEQASLELAEQSAHLSSLLDTIPDPIWLKNTEGVFLACNRAVENLLGVPVEKILGHTESEFLDPEQVKHVRAYDQEAIQAGRAITKELWVDLASNHRQALMETIKAPVLTPGGQLIGVLGIARDITERKRTEEELRRNHQLLVNLTNHSPGAVYQFRMFPDGRSCLPYVSAGFSSLFGLSQEQVLEDASPLLDLVHPDDVKRFHDSVRISAESGQLWHLEWRMQLPMPKGIRCFRGDSSPEKLEDGSTLWHGFVIDITAQQQAEENQRLAALVFQSSSEAIIVTDKQNKIISANPAFEHMTGYCRNEVFGKDPNILNSGQQSKDFYNAMWKILLSSNFWEGEFINRRKDGKLYVAQMMINTVRDEDDAIRYHVGLATDITHRKESERLIWQQANFDAVTGLPNRTMFRNQLELELKKSDRSNLKTGLLLLDLDHFKDVNDTLGHDMGDMLLKMAAQRLRGCVRDSDIVARLGGDEFVVILGELSETGSVERVVNSILEKMSTPFDLVGNQTYISTSVGVTIYPDDALEIDDLIKKADQAMYAAKHEGRNRRNYFTQSMQDAALTKMKLIADLRMADANREFQLHYQPIIDLATEEIYKAEALIRWEHPTRGLISPAEFIPVAEETGIINEIGNWVFYEASRQAAKWRQTQHADFQLSVNMSAIQFRQPYEFFENWLAHMKKTSLPGAGVALEITESLLLDASKDVNRLLLAFSEAQIQVAIDDFGTGYSSLSYIKQFDIDYIKIDRSFTANLAPGSSDLALCEAIIVMAHKLGLKLIAEGVETEEQRALLKEIGCDFGQGYLFSRPLPADEFEEMMRSKKGGIAPRLRSSDAF